MGKVLVDVRNTSPFERHKHILDTFSSLEGGDIMELVNDRDPKPLWYQMSAEMPDMFEWQYVVQGPVEWRVNIKKLPDSTHKNVKSCENEFPPIH